VDFSEARDLFVNIFQILRPNCKILGLRVDFGKAEGPKCKMSEIPEIMNYFQQINSWTGSTHGEPGRARAVHRGPAAARTEGAGARWCAHRCTASGRSGAPKLTGGGAKEREEHGEFGSEWTS
jgi:hypothetical protein